MAAKDLITSARAADSLGGAQGNANLTLQANEYTTLTDLITSASDAIEKYCRRPFFARTIDELYDGGADRLYLREYPVQSVAWVRYSPQTLLEVQNTDAATNQRATVQVTSTGLTLVRVHSGVSATDTSVTFAGNATLQGVAAAIIALGNGWTARVAGSPTGDFGLWPSADLYVPPYIGDGVQSMGALNCRGVYAALKMHAQELSDYAWHPSGYLYRLGGGTWPAAPNTWDMSGGFAAGFGSGGVGGYWRIKYTAGYTTIPEAVQEACAEWVAALWWHTKRDPAVGNTLSTAGAATGYRDLSGRVIGHPPDAVRTLLAPYRRHTAGTNQG